jgi:hypothetical protein
MLGSYTSHKDYITFALGELKTLAETRPDQIAEYENAVLKMLILDLDPMLPVIQPLYSSTGRPAKLQMEIFRSFILMDHTRVPFNEWAAKLINNPVLRAVAGFTLENMPSTSSYYDFINRIIPLADTPILKSFKSKPKKKLKKGEKLPPKNKDIVAKLVDRILSDENNFLRQLSRRPERFLQKVFARVAVDSSIKIGLIPSTVSVSGDGTCVKTGSSHYGKKVCKCMSKGIYKCNCPRKFSDPSANWGWDSHKECYFYGHTGYFFSTHNNEEKVDLPLYLRLLQANRHDSVSAIFALAEFRELSPNLTIDTFISDSASDNYATYKLLNHWDINPVIALSGDNRGNTKYPPALNLDHNGIPICPSGHKMLYHGYCKGRHRIKWRCPRSFTRLGLTDIPPCEGCSKSPYGRVIYTKTDWDIRLFTRIPRGSDVWKAKMNQRTAVERINNRILHDYGIENDSTRGKKRISFMITVAAVNIHLDAQLKVLRNRGLLSIEQLLAGTLAL